MFIIYFAFIKISDRIFHELSNDELNLRFVKVSSENISKGSYILFLQDRKITISIKSATMMELTSDHLLTIHLNTIYFFTKRYLVLKTPVL